MCVVYNTTMEEVLEEGMFGRTIATEEQQQQQQQNQQTMLVEMDQVSEDNIVGNIRDYIRLDNMRVRLSEEIKQLRDPSKSLKNIITQYMVSKTIMRIPIKKNGDEFIELKTRVKTRKPSREEMVHNLHMLIQSNEVLDKSSEEIIDLITMPVQQEETYVLNRKCKRKRKGSSTATPKIDISLCNVRCLRDLMMKGGNVTTSSTIMCDQEQQRHVQETSLFPDMAVVAQGDGPLLLSSSPPLKRRHV